MRKSHVLVAVGLIASAVASVAPGASGPLASGTARYDVVVRGLHNPRGITVGEGGAVYVAEAGRGGPRCTPVQRARLCEGATGSITKVFPDREVVLAGLPSLARPGGYAAIGPADVHARAETLFAVLGDRHGLPAPLERSEFGTILQVIDRTHANQRADVSEYEALVDPDGLGVDPNPTSLTTFGTRFYAVDAGGNSVWRFNQYGVANFNVVIPGGQAEYPAGSGQFVDYESVPTAITIGPDSAVYVAELTGFPFPVGAADVYRIEGGLPVVVESGFTNIIDIAFGPDGSLYVLEIARAGLLETGPDGLTAGRLVRVHPDGTREVLSGNELRSPGGVAVSPTGDVYVTNRSTRPTTGGVLRYHPVRAFASDEGR